MTVNNAIKEDCMNVIDVTWKSMPCSYCGAEPEQPCLPSASNPHLQRLRAAADAFRQTNHTALLDLAESHRLRALSEDEGLFA